MEQTITIIYTISSTLLLCFIIYYKLFFRRNNKSNLPPSPPSIPIIGHLHLLKHPVHKTLRTLSEKYGHVISLRFGSRLAVIISSPSAVEECFTKNDIVLANRPELLAGKYIGYNYTTMAGAPYGDHWRNLRRIAATDILSASRLNVFSAIRRDEARKLVGKLARETHEGYFMEVELKQRLVDLTFNVIMRMVAGKSGSGGGERRFRKVVGEVFEQAGTSNPCDYLPILNWIGWDNYEKKLKLIGDKMDECLQNLIDEFRRSKGSSENTMIDHLLYLQQSEPDYYSDHIIKGLIMNRDV